MRILLLSPYHSGSHRAWSEGYQRTSGHDVELVTLPGRFWKWRMHGAAVTFARRMNEQWSAGEPLPDLILTDGMLDFATFAALTRRHTAKTPLALYMHENQLTYPLPNDPTTGPMRRQHNERDRHYVFINLTSMHVADRIFFNSEFHRESWFTQLPKFLNHFPDYREQGSIASLREKSHVLPVGIDLKRLTNTAVATSSSAITADAATPNNPEPPLIIWNQRWEYDKNPDAFFATLRRCAARGGQFRLALCGENFSQAPAAFDQANNDFADRIIHRGHADSETYRSLLHEAEITISTANHEFFGISVIEATACGVFPILPLRLSYPELIPAELHEAVLYQTDDELDARLDWALQHPQQRRDVAEKLAKKVQQYDWSIQAPRYDESFTALVKEMR